MVWTLFTYFEEFMSTKIYKAHCVIERWNYRKAEEVLVILGITKSGAAELAFKNYFRNK